MPRVGSSSSSAPGSSPAPLSRPATTIARARRWRSPPERSRGSASTIPSRPKRRSDSSPSGPAKLIADALVDEQVAGPLRQERHARGAPPRGRAAGRAARPPRAGACSCPRRCCPSARRAPPLDLELRAPERLRALLTRPQLDPDVAGGECGRLPAPGVAGSGRGAPRADDLDPATASTPSAPPGRWAAAATRRRRAAARRAWPVPRRAPCAQPRNSPGGPSKEIAPSSSAITRSAAARQRSSRCSPSSTATPHSSFRRRSREISSSPATGSSWEVGSSSSTSLGRVASAAASATRCSSPPESVSVVRSSRWSIASARATSSTARERAAGATPRSSSGSSISARTVVLTTCVSGSWATMPDSLRQLGRPVRADVHPGDLELALDRARRGSAAPGRSRRGAAWTSPTPSARRARRTRRARRSARSPRSASVPASG